MMREEDERAYSQARLQMVRTQIVIRGIRDTRVIEAMEQVPRHKFVPSVVRHRSYEDCALPIGHQQTISQPYIVALVLQLAHLLGREHVLEIGTGSGYSTALLSRLAAYVFTIERVEPLATRAKQLLGEMDCDNVRFFHGDGSKGHAAEAPYDVILIWAAAANTPSVMFEQLADGGLLIVPEADRPGRAAVARAVQTLVRYEKQERRIIRTDICAVSFVPLVENHWNPK